MNKKKALVLVLAAAMTMGSSMAAFADEPATSGTTTGKGTNEGHVDKEVINVVLPTVDSGSSPFSYIADPGRLIQGTDGAKYEDVTFPESDGDTGVYFQVGDKEYANKSKTLQVLNKSSVNVKVSVKFQAESSGTKDLALATDGEAGCKKESPLYLNVKVGTKAVTTAEQTVEKVIGGKDGNFEVVYADGNYKYQPKADANKWNALEISVNGKVSDEAEIESDTTVPNLKVTWSYAKEDTTPVDSSDQVEYSEGPSASVSSSGLVTVSGLTKTSNYNKKMTFEAKGLTKDQSDNSLVWDTKNWTDENGGTFTVQMPEAWVTYWSGEEVTITISLTDGKTITAKGRLS